MPLEYVTKRNGNKQAVDWAKVDGRLNYLNSHPTQLSCNASFVADRVREMDGVDGLETKYFDERAAKVAADFAAQNPDFLILSSRISISNHHKGTLDCFSSTMEACYRNRKLVGKQGRQRSAAAPRINTKLYKFVQLHKNKLNRMIDYDRDYRHTDFGFAALMDRYLIKRSGDKHDVEQRPQDYAIERPQDMWMRVACAIHMNRNNLADDTVLDEVQETYDLLSLGYIMHATPTLYNAGTLCEQLLSCFPAGTKVFTTNAGTINIEDVEIGDSVITHMGRTRRVTQLHKNPLGDRKVFNVECYMTPEFKVTGNHKLWSVTQEQLGWSEGPQWNATESLRVGDYIAVPKYEGSIRSGEIDLMSYQKFKCPVPNQSYSYGSQIVNDDGHMVEYMTRNTDYEFTVGGKPRRANRDGVAIKRCIKVDADFAKFLGIWYGDGHIQVNKSDVAGVKYEKNIGIGITAHLDNAELIEFVENFSQKYFGITVNKYRQGDSKCYSLMINSGQLADVWEMLFGKGFAGKIMWEPIFEWCTELIEPFLAGLISTDGCVSKDGNITLQLSNQAFMENLFNICRRAGVLVSLKKKPNGKLATCPAYQMSFAKDNPIIQRVKHTLYKTYADGRLDVVKRAPNGTPYKIIDGVYYVRINGKTPDREFHDEWVYTLGVEEDHSYSIAGITAQNCYLLGGEDSIEGIGKINADMLKLSKHSGGIGWWWPLRSSGSEVSMTNGTSGGPEPFLRMIEASMKAANQGGKRPGSAANYNDPAHPDTMRWLKLRRADASNNIKDLFYALWIHDEFMTRVVNNELWYWVDPHEQPQLYGMIGEAYSAEYCRLIAEGLTKGDPIPAREVLMEACETQAEGGMPYVLFADAINNKSNMKNIMAARCSNLCCEVTIPSSSKEYGCCAISSVCLPSFVIDCDCTKCADDPDYKWVAGDVAGHQQGCNGTKRVDYDYMAYCTGVLVRNLNKISDINYYPVEEARRSQMRHRPLGIGVQGLADVFHLLKYPFTSQKARAENKRIFESIYYGGVHASMELAKRDGAYETFRGDPLNNPDHPDMLSPAAEGKLQFDLWGLSADKLMGRWDWDNLKQDVQTYGLRNALITALPPTASTSHIQGFNECFEPYTDNIYVRKTLSGENIVINHHLVKDLVALGLWTTALRNRLIADRGSVQGLDVPAWIKEQYKTVWELDNRILIDMDAERAPFVDQTQSSNRFMSNPTAKKLFAMFLRCWRAGLKTGMYYLRSQSKSKATQFSEAVKVKEEATEEVRIDIPEEEQNVICMLKKKNGVMCYTCQ